MGIKSNITTPLRRETFKNLQLNAGLVLVNFDIGSYSDAGALKTALDAAIVDGTKLLGATRGGGNFNITREIRNVEVDGMRQKFVGSEIVDSADAYLSTTLLEITPEHLKAVIGNADIDNTEPTHVIITIRTAIEDEDYLPNLVWVGDTSEGFLAIELENALNTADFTLTYADKNEGTLNCEYHAHQADVSGDNTVPVKIHYLTGGGTLGELTVSSAAGTNVGETVLTKNYTLASGEHFVYKVGSASAAPAIAYHEEADYSWAEWSGTGAINVGASADGKKLTLAVVDNYGRAIKSGNCTLAVKTA